MKNKVLFRMYLERIVLLVPAILVLSYLIVDIIYYDMMNFSLFSDTSNTLFALELLLIVFTVWYMAEKMHDAAENNFINALPVTKSRQFSVVFAVLSLIAACMVLVADMIHFIKYEEYHLATKVIRGWLAGSVAKISMMLLVISVLLWVFSHIMMKLWKFLLSLILFGITLAFIEDFFTRLQQIFGYQGNHFYLVIQNTWDIITGPLYYVYDYYLTFAEISRYYPDDSHKAVIFLSYEIVVLAVSVVFFYLARKKYMSTDFSVSTRKIRRCVPKMVQIIGTAFFMMLLFGWLGGLILTDTGGRLVVRKLFSEAVEEFQVYSTGLIPSAGYTGVVLVGKVGGLMHNVYQTTSTISLKILYLLFLGTGAFFGVLVQRIAEKLFLGRERRKTEHEKNTTDTI